jgi:Ca2+:H+ antiporter
VRADDWTREWPLALAVVTLAATLLGHGRVTEMLDSPAALIGLLVVICAVILAAAIAIVRHAEILAHRLGEPLERCC